MKAIPDLIVAPGRMLDFSRVWSMGKAHHTGDENEQIVPLQQVMNMQH